MNHVTHQIFRILVQYPHFMSICQVSKNPHDKSVLTNGYRDEHILFFCSIYQCLLSTMEALYVSAPYVHRELLLVMKMCHNTTVAIQL